MDDKEEERIEAVNRYIMGDKPSNICKDANRSEKWLFTWLKRFKTGEEEWYKPNQTHRKYMEDKRTKILKAQL